MAVFELLARAAGTVVIAAWVAPGLGIVLVKARRCGRGGRGSALLRRHLLNHGLLLFLGQHTDLTQLLGHVRAKRIQHAFKQGETLGLVFVQRVALRITPETNNRAQVFQRQKVLAPFFVDDLQEDLFLDVAHPLGTEVDRLLGHRLV